jgi:acetyltransferase
VRLRLFQNLKSLPNELASRISQIDYLREMSFVAVARADGDGTRAGELLGLVQLAATPELDQAEYGIIVRSDMKGRGVGYMLMQKLIAYARAQGMARLYGDVLRENAGMLRLCREFGFAIRTGDDPAVLHTELSL